MSGIRPRDQDLRGFDKPVVHFPVLPVVFSNAPLLQGILLDRLEALLLRVLAEVHPELEDQCTVIGERPLERINAFQRVPELYFAGSFVNVVE